MKHQAPRTFISRKRLLTSLALVVASAAFAAGRMLWPESGPRPAGISSVPASNEVESLRRELAQVRRESARLQIAVSDIARRRVLPSTDTSDDPGVPSVPEDAPAVPSSASSRDEHLAQLEAEFETETRDSAWHPIGEIRSLTNAALPKGSTLRAVECRSSMCRLEIGHRSLDDYKQFTDTLFSADLARPVWAGAVAFDVRHPAREGDEIVAIGYFGRESLPELAVTQP